MHRRQEPVYQKIFFIVAVPLISLSATFILLYIFVALRNADQIAPLKTGIVTYETPIAAKISPLPVRLTISKISTDAVVSPVGLNSVNDMDINDDPTQLAWYEPGPKPGEEGSAVIAGHYGWKDGVPSVFNDINKLVKGDEITIFDQEGAKKTFVVTRTALYKPNQDATTVFKSDDGKSHLNLITCQGSWVKSDSTYSERLVVFTDYVE